jgi:hypothetical protein
MGDTTSTIDALGLVLAVSDNKLATMLARICGEKIAEAGAGAGGKDAVLYTKQTLAEEQQEQARKNIGASKVSLLDDFIANTDIAHIYDETTGAYYTVIRVYKQRIDGTYQYPFVYAPNGANAGNKSTLDMTKGDGWLLAINSGVFDTATKKPDGIVIQNGAVIKASPTTTHSQCKPLTIDRTGNLGYAEYNADANQLVGNGIVSAVCGFIPIIVDYNAVPQSEWNSVSHYTENAQRQIIGQWGNGDYAIITCEGRGFHNSDGWTIAEAQTICRKHGLKFAYNLDGGGSTETMLGLKPVNTIYENTTGRIVPTFIVFNGTTNFGDVVVPEPEVDSTEYVLLTSSGIVLEPNIGYGTINSTQYRMCAVSAENSPKLPESEYGVLTGKLTDYAPIALPEGATAITIVCPEFTPAVTFWATDGENWTRTADPGWMTAGGGTYILPSNVNYTHYAVNFKKTDYGEITQDTDISGISITVQTTTEPEPEPEPEIGDTEYVILNQIGITLYPNIGYGTIDLNQTRSCAISVKNTPKLPIAKDSASTGELTDYAPIALPEEATAITIVCPEFIPAVTLWTTDGEHWTRTVDPGWMALGGGTYFLPTDAEYTHYAVNFKNSNSSAIDPDTDTSGISITIQTAVEEPDFSELGNLYRLPAETVFSGDDYIDTGVKLNETDIDFTIAFSVTPGTQNNTIPQIFNCQKEASPYPGFCFSCHKDTPYYRFAAGSGSNHTTDPKDSTEPFKVVITHKKGTSLYELKHLYNGVVLSGDRNGVAMTHTNTDVNFIIGAWQNTDGSKGRYWVGTMHDFFIDDYVWDDAIITAYLK